MPLTKKYMQARDGRWKLSDATEDGACFSLSAYWIIMTMSSKDPLGKFWDWLGAPASALGITSAQNPDTKSGGMAEVYTVMANQALAIKKDPSSAPQAKAEYMAKVIESQSHLHPTKDSEGFLVRNLDKPRRYESLAEKWAKTLAVDRGYKYLSLAGRWKNQQTNTYHNLQHAMAIFTGSATYVIFDPNFGLYEADTECGFQTDLAAIFEQYGFSPGESFYTVFQHEGW